jgi:hypothetical protein
MGRRERNCKGDFVGVMGIMLAKPVIEYLLTRSELMSLVSDYNGSKAIFHISAPAEAAEPYLVINYRQNIGPDKSVMSYNLFFDYYDYDKSKVNAELFAKRLEIAFEGLRLSSDDHLKIRFSWFAGEFVDEADTLSIHYNTQFTVKTDRKYWTDTL